MYVCMYVCMYVYIYIWNVLDDVSDLLSKRSKLQSIAAFHATRRGGAARLRVSPAPCTR